MRVELADIAVEWVDLGEGWNGDYDPSDAGDAPLLRFDTYRKVDGGWEPFDDGSYCTAMPVGTDEATLRSALWIIADEVHQTFASGGSVKKVCEHLSWISPSWVV